MFKKKNKVAPAPEKDPVEKYKFRSLKRVDECANLHKTCILAQEVADADREAPIVEINCCKCM